MIQISTKNELESKISTGEPLLIYFSSETCSVCVSLKAKIEKEVSKNFPKMKIYEIKADKYKEIASNFLVFSIPTILVFFDQKEFRRYGRNLSLAQFVNEIKRPYTLFMD